MYGLSLFHFYSLLRTLYLFLMSIFEQQYISRNKKTLQTQKADIPKKIFQNLLTSYRMVTNIIATERSIPIRRTFLHINGRRDCRKKYKLALDKSFVSVYNNTNEY